MKKIIITQAFFFTFLIVTSPVFAQVAQADDVTKIQTFIQSIIQVLVTLAGFTAAGFFVFGGIKYITSSGSPEAMESAKKTIVYSAVGLTIALGAFVLSNIITQLATAAFGK